MAAGAAGAVGRSGASEAPALAIQVARPREPIAPPKHAGPRREARGHRQNFARRRWQYLRCNRPDVGSPAGELPTSVPVLAVWCPGERRFCASSRRDLKLNTSVPKTPSAEDRVSGTEYSVRSTGYRVLRGLGPRRVRGGAPFSARFGPKKEPVRGLSTVAAESAGPRPFLGQHVPFELPRL